MESQSAFQVEFDFGTSKPVVVEPSAGQLSSDAGLLPFRQLDEQLELTASFAACLNERRDPESIRHPQRLFCAFEYQADSWDQPRWVIVKCEANAQGTNRRAVVTSRPGGRVLPAAAYDQYADRGESENRNKELKCGLRSDRLSDHRYFANPFRLYLHALAYNLLARMRHVVEEPPACEHEDPQRAELPDEALAGRARRRQHNRRRQRDPLGQGQPCTWRTRLIKVTALVWESTRRVVVQLSSSWPYLEH